MTLERFQQMIATGKPLAGEEMITFMREQSDATRRLLFDLNGSYHSPEEIVALFSRITDNKVDDSFRLFPPFYTDFGKNIHLGKNVFINSCCQFQDQGGIFIGDGALIGHSVVMATLNHGFAPDDRQNLYHSPIHIGKGVIRYGSVASYIPELAKADKNKLGICLYTIDGNQFETGNTEDRFTIQSISKVMALCLALETFGAEFVFNHVGVEPSGEAFNSLVELDNRSNRPFNPMINSGAITVASLLVNHYSIEDMQKYMQDVCEDPEIAVDEAVFQSEMATCARNKAIAYLLKSKEIIDTDVEDSVTFYTKMCSMSVNARDLAMFGLLIANDGVQLSTGKRLISSQTVRMVQTIMLTCGMYDGSGEFALRTGIPTKSGVGGGLLSVSKKKMGIGIYGPSLDKKGNCIAGCELLGYISEALHLHIFDTREWKVEE